MPDHASPGQSTQQPSESTCSAAIPCSGVAEVLLLPHSDLTKQLNMQSCGHVQQHIYNQGQLKGSELACSPVLHMQHAGGQVHGRLRVWQDVHRSQACFRWWRHPRPCQAVEGPSGAAGKPTLTMQAAPFSVACCNATFTLSLLLGSCGCSDSHSLSSLYHWRLASAVRRQISQLCQCKTCNRA